MRKIITASIIALLLLAAMPVSYAAPSNIKPYKGWVGADSPLYGLKLFIQNLDESFAGDSNARLQKQLAHAEERLAEALAASENSAALSAAINAYNETINEINDTMEEDDVNETDYSDVGPEIDDQQEVLDDLINNSTSDETQSSLIGAYTSALKLKTGRPYITYNNTTYFIPPGQWRKGINSTFVPSGLAKKGIKSSRDLWLLNDTDAINQTNKQLGHGNWKK